MYHLPSIGRDLCAACVRPGGLGAREVTDGIGARDTVLLCHVAIRHGSPKISTSFPLSFELTLP